jgi:hypothetical protein
VGKDLKGVRTYSGKRSNWAYLWHKGDRAIASTAGALLLDTDIRFLNAGFPIRAEMSSRKERA